MVLILVEAVGVVDGEASNSVTRVTSAFTRGQDER
jgi:hypothetical protein